MYHLYLEKHEPEFVGQTTSKGMDLQKILNEEFNHGFGYPCSDTCEQCD